jgi:predicted transcriptional regulator
LPAQAGEATIIFLIQPLLYKTILKKEKNTNRKKYYKYRLFSKEGLGCKKEANKIS